MKPTLLILAAGMGRRYNGLKQIDPVGPNGELIIDYSIYDAIKAGFGRIVFVIRHEFEKAFRLQFGDKYTDRIETAYAYQEMDSFVNGIQIPPDREKPWGTGHAILTAKDVINEPFAVINADDFYGSGAFKAIAKYLSESNNLENEYCMVGYRLKNTLSKHGHVCRGICKLDEKDLLLSVSEHTNVKKDENGAKGLDGNGHECFIDIDRVVSMNLWGFMPSIFSHLQEQFDEFLKKRGDDPKAEFFIPSVVDVLVHNGNAKVKVLGTDEKWFGVSYREDMSWAKENVSKLIHQGVYPEKLWQ